MLTSAIALVPRATAGRSPLATRGPKLTAALCAAVDRQRARPYTARRANEWERAPNQLRRRPRAKRSLRQLDGLVRVVDVELDPKAGAPGADAYLTAKRRGERILGGAERLL